MIGFNKDAFTGASPHDHTGDLFNFFHGVARPQYYALSASFV